MTTTARRFFLVPAWAALALALTAAHAPAQESGAQDAAGLEQRRAQSAAEHDRILQALTLSEERAARIEAEIAAIRKDNASLSAALVQAAKTERKLSAEVETISARLAGLGIEQDALRASLAARRDVLAEVLGALQRMGLNPPPAILVRPEDALASVRSSILLASVVPGLRGETEVLIADLRQLQRLAGEIETGRRRAGARGRACRRGRLARRADRGAGRRDRDRRPAGRTVAGCRTGETGRRAHAAQRRLPCLLGDEGPARPARRRPRRTPLRRQ
jgi:septal ring factor EnvC (AmiA/AmiB activator)